MFFIEAVLHANALTWALTVSLQCWARESHNAASEAEEPREGFYEVSIVAFFPNSQFQNK